MKFLTATTFLLAFGAVMATPALRKLDDCAASQVAGGEVCFTFAPYGYEEFPENPFARPEEGWNEMTSGFVCVSKSETSDELVVTFNTEGSAYREIWYPRLYVGSDPPTETDPENFPYKSEVKSATEYSINVALDPVMCAAGGSYTLNLAAKALTGEPCDPKYLEPGQTADDYIVFSEWDTWAVPTPTYYEQFPHDEVPLVGVTVECSCPTADPFPGPPRDDTPTTTSPPGTRGDPHFKTHGGEMYDFHGGCDLVLVDNPDFMDGLGMLVHIRTKIETWWSYVESSVLKVGEDIVEITGSSKTEWLFINGKAVELPQVNEWYTTHFGELKLRYRHDGSNGEAHLYFGNSKAEKIVLRTFNEFVKVDVGRAHQEGTDYYTKSLGLLGRFPDGARVGRDGQTVIEDVNAFGQEWQVKADEPKLFRSYEGDWIVPAGQKCAMPVETSAKKALRQRRLANGMPMEEAEKACAHLADQEKKACIFDVIATQNVNMAAVW